MDRNRHLVLLGLIIMRGTRYGKLSEVRLGDTVFEPSSPLLTGTVISIGLEDEPGGPLFTKIAIDFDEYTKDVPLCWIRKVW